MGAGASNVKRRRSLPVAATKHGTGGEERAELELVGRDETTNRPAELMEAELHAGVDGNTPRSKSVLLNRAMTEALRRNNIDECATLGRELLEMPVQWVAEQEGEHHKPMLSKVDKPNRAILAAVCGVKAAQCERRGLLDDARYARKLAAMFASSLGPAECLSKATVDCARDAYALQVRHGRESGLRRQSC